MNADEYERRLRRAIYLSRACSQGRHNACHGEWTRYPDQGGPCECARHKSDSEVTKRLQQEYGIARDMLALHLDIDDTAAGYRCE